MLHIRFFHCKHGIWKYWKCKLEMLQKILLVVNRMYCLYSHVKIQMLSRTLVICLVLLYMQTMNSDFNTLMACLVTFGKKPSKKKIRLFGEVGETHEGGHYICFHICGSTLDKVEMVIIRKLVDYFVLMCKLSWHSHFLTLS